MRVGAIFVAYLVICLAAFGLGTPAAAQEPPAPELDVVATWTPPAGTIGGRFTLTVDVTHADTALVTVQRPAIADAELVSDTQPVSDPQADGRVTTTYAFEYQVFRLGEIDSGTVRVDWLLGDGSSGTAERPGTVMTILPVRAEGDGLLRPLKPQASIQGAPPAWVRPAAIGGAALLAVGLVAGIALWWRRRRREEPAPALVAVAEASARERLDALRHLRLDDEDTFQRFYGEIALVVRRYLGDRFAFNASALTTSELERRMTVHGIDRWQARLVGGLLDRCDRAVYARQYPDPESADHDLTLAYEIVELSRPRPTAVETVA